VIAVSDGCAACGVVPVGEPLPRPEIELPSYGRSLLLSIMGSLLGLVFFIETAVSMSSRITFSAGVYSAGVGLIDFGSWFSAAQTAAWRLKFVMIPITIVVFWFGRKLYRSVVAAPESFCGLRYARRGYFAAAAVPLLVLVLIGVTVPTRLRRHQWAIEAAQNAQAYRIDRALDEYRAEFGTLPSDLKDLSRLPDSDGSIAAALKNLDYSGYKASADLASAPKKPQTLRGAVIMKASSLSPDVSLTESISFTNYELRLPGPDKVLGTEDDLVVDDGLITKVSENPKRSSSTATTNRR
jgi:hypothetical protein